MALLKNDAIIKDSWTQLDDDADIAGTAKPIVNLARWTRDRETLLGHNGEIGIVPASDEPPALIAEDVHRFGVICLDFPKFTDGRGYSYARLLRSRYNYTGELRAVGNVLRDQALFMRRCGFDALEIGEGRSTDGWRQAFAELSVRYQPDEAAPSTKIAQPDPAPYLTSEVAGSWSY
tara:strand:+ start:21 stop:551 length:531 start_codon:yes stop_codon:yes gene_type:complete